MLPHTKAVILLVTYFLCTIFLCFGAYQFMNSTEARFSAPAGTMVRNTEELAFKIMQRGQIFHDPLFILVSSANDSAPDVVLSAEEAGGNHSAVVERMQDSALCVLARFVEGLKAHPDKHNTHHIADVTSFCTFEHFSNFARQLVAEDNRSALIAVDMNVSASGVLKQGQGPQHIVAAIEDYLGDTMPRSLREQITVDTTSIVQVFNSLKSNLLGDLLKIDLIAVPLASIALVLCVRSTRLAIIPIPTVVISVSLAMSICWPISTVFTFSSFSNEFMSGVLLAISLDFSLFLCSRFRERCAMAKLQGFDLDCPRQRLEIVVDTAVLTSHNIVVSGSAVACALGFLLVIPVSAVSSIGLALLIGALCVVFVSLTFQPAMMLVFFHFFSEDPVFDKLLAWSPRLNRLFADPLLDEAGMIPAVQDQKRKNRNNANQRGGGTLSKDSLLHPTTANNTAVGNLTLNERQQDQNYSNLGFSTSVTGQTGTTSGTPSGFDDMNQRGADLINYPRGSTHRMSASLSSSTGNFARLGAPGAQNGGPAGADSSVHLATPDASAYNNTNTNSDNELLSLRMEDISRRAQERSTWFKLACVVMEYPWVTLLIVAAIFAPFIWLTTKAQLSFDLSLQTPVGNPYVDTLTKISHNIGSGSLSVPFYVTMDGGRPHAVARTVDYRNETLLGNTTIPVLAVNDSFWRKSQELVMHLHEKMAQPLDKIMTVSQFPGMNATWFNSTLLPDALLLCAATASHWHLPEEWAEDHLEPCLEYQLLFNRSVDHTHRMAIMMVPATVNPFGDKSFGWCNQLRGTLESFDAEGVFELGFFGASSDSCAILHKMNEKLPLQLGLMGAVIFLITLVAFRSVFISIRLIVCLAAPVATAIGVGVLFFQYAPLNKMWPIESEAISWTVLCFVEILGCALGADYDVFLLARLCEYRQVGYTTQAATKRAVSRSGRVISFAGLIMLFSFGAMCFTNIMMMQAFGFMSGAAVLIDTFIVRPLVVPSMFSIADRLSKRLSEWTGRNIDIVWWPRRFDAEPTLTEDDQVEVQDDLASPRWLLRWLGGDLYPEDGEHAPLMRSSVVSDGRKNPSDDSKSAKKRGDSLYGTGPEEYH